MFPALPALTVAACLVVVWPPAQSAFHEPKRWVFVVATLLSLSPTGERVGVRGNLPALALLLSTALTPWRHAEQGLQALTFAGALILWPRFRPTLTTSARVLMLPAALAGAVVLLQALGIDPLHASAQGTRLRLYGTLGNPDFVASALLPVGWLVLGGATGRWRLISAAFIAGALVVTQSFATLGALVVSGVVFELSRRRVTPHPDPLPRWGEGVMGLVLVSVLATSLFTRDLRASLAGRAYLVSVVAPHLTEHPLLGHGLGATLDEWPAWELAHWQARCPDAACVSAHPEGRFTGLQDHVHADFLEVLLERGLLGLAALLLSLALPLRSLLARRDADAPWLLAALTAALSRALVDFPLHRPADLAVLALLCVLALPPPQPR